jgi:hypothetical protein
VAHETDHNQQLPEDPGALTRNELFAHALAFAEEIVRWKVWYVKGYEPGPAQASLPEAEAIQALSQVLVELLDGVMGARLKARPDFATVASYLGYILHDTISEPDTGRPDPKRIQEALERHDDVAFLHQHGLKFPDDDSQQDAS